MVGTQLQFANLLRLYIIFYYYYIIGIHSELVIQFRKDYTHVGTRHGHATRLVAFFSWARTKNKTITNKKAPKKKKTVCCRKWKDLTTQPCASWLGMTSWGIPFSTCNAPCRVGDKQTDVKREWRTSANKTAEETYRIDRQRERDRQRKRKREREIDRERERERERKSKYSSSHSRIYPKTERVTHCGKGTHRSYNVKFGQRLSTTHPHVSDYILLKTQMGNENRWQIELLRRFGVYTFFREWEDPSESSRSARILSLSEEGVYADRAGKIRSPCRHLRPKNIFGDQITGRGGQFGD